ncbi:MAG: glycosyltransferase family 8 protein, partial [Flavobacterium sp.]
MKNKNNITLVVACNDHFAIMLGALIKSIIHNHVSSEEIDLYIVDDGISVKSKNRIIECAGNHINLIWLKINDIFENVKLPVDNSTFPRNVYMRLFIPTFLPLEVKKAIYLDVDMINCVDISNLWNVSLDGHPIAGVRDRSAVISNDWGGIGNYKELNLNPETPYYNAGLIVYNN